MEAPPLISEHDTWISLDPLAGCPASCAYCYLNLTHDTGVAPRVRIAPEGLIRELEPFLLRRRRGVFAEESPRPPVCIGNYTDMLMTQRGREFLQEYARLHKARLPEYPLCVVTKAALKPRDVSSLDAIGLRLLVFVSQSFFKDFELGGLEQGPVAQPAATAANLRILAQSRNLVPIHFWRPLTLANVPDLQSACAQLTLVKEAGALASVAIGLKGSREWPSRDAKLGPLLGPSPPEICGEHMPGELLDRILAASRKTQHPVYRATSCAIALVLGHPETLGMWRASFRAHYCDPCLCPNPQRTRCEAARSASKPPPPDLLKSIASDLKIDRAQVTWCETSQMIQIGGTLSQEDHSRLTHLAGNRIAADEVIPTRAWLGAITEHEEPSGGNAGPINFFRDCSWLPAALQRGVHRLKGITGLATTLTTATDRRPLAFSRYFHVQRIASVAESVLQNQLANDAVLDVEYVAWLAWVHDLNRWPFAHNSERGHFQQGEDYQRYLRKQGINVSARELSDLKNVEAKLPHALSAEGQVVLLADMIGGFLEDILLCIQGLDLAPALIPEAVLDVLRLPLGSAGFRQRLLKSNELLFRTRDIDGFVEGFNRIYAECISVLLQDFRGQRVAEIVTSSRLREMRRVVRQEFIDQTLFAYNNEKISKGAALREHLVAPMLAASIPDLDMTEITEAEFVSLAVSLGKMEADSASFLVPDIDYFMHREPSLSFRLTEGIVHSG